MSFPNVPSTRQSRGNSLAPHRELFDKDETTGRTQVLRPKPTTLAQRLRGCPDAGFVAFVGHLLTVDAEQRPTAVQALQHPWLAATLDEPPAAES